MTWNTTDLSEMHRLLWVLHTFNMECKWTCHVPSYQTLPTAHRGHWYVVLVIYQLLRTLGQHSSCVPDVDGCEWKSYIYIYINMQANYHVLETTKWWIIKHYSFRTQFIWFTGERSQPMRLNFVYIVSPLIMLHSSRVLWKSISTVLFPVFTTLNELRTYKNAKKYIKQEQNHIEGVL